MASAERTNITNTIISVTGLGYVGIPLAVEFAKKFQVIGFDISQRRVDELRWGYDRTREVSSEALQKSKLNLTTNPADLQRANFHIITVPTPVTAARTPDLAALVSASETIGRILKKRRCGCV